MAKKMVGLEQFEVEGGAFEMDRKAPVTSKQFRLLGVLTKMHREATGKLLKRPENRGEASDMIDALLQAGYKPDSSKRRDRISRF
jgi:hypothetical protein